MQMKAQDRLLPNAMEVIKVRMYKMTEVFSERMNLGDFFTFLDKFVTDLCLLDYYLSK